MISGNVKDFHLRSWKVGMFMNWTTTQQSSQISPCSWFMDRNVSQIYINVLSCSWWFMDGTESKGLKGVWVPLTLWFLSLYKHQKQLFGAVLFSPFQVKRNCRRHHKTAEQWGASCGTVVPFNGVCKQTSWFMALATNRTKCIFPFDVHPYWRPTACQNRLLILTGNSSVWSCFVCLCTTYDDSSRMLINNLKVFGE